MSGDDKIHCDYCTATLKRGPDVLYSGWRRYGVHYTNGTGVASVACPTCQIEYELSR